MTRSVWAGSFFVVGNGKAAQLLIGLGFRIRKIVTNTVAELSPGACAAMAIRRRARRFTAKQSHDPGAQGRGVPCLIRAQIQASSQQNQKLKPPPAHPLVIAPRPGGAVHSGGNPQISGQFSPNIAI
ncbi:hypothetical protein [Microbulbifer sp. S227A]|uniref:hypothetical protein n=1 Tax=Microbulbifer sp. S227A TaxID=3415131 RepID=UPI003C7C04AC